MTRQLAAVTAAVAVAFSVAGCGTGHGTPPARAAASSSSPAPGAHACEVAMDAITAARALVTTPGGSAPVPDVQAAGKLLSHASTTVSRSGVPMFHTLAGSVAAGLDEAAFAAGNAVLMAVMGRGAAARKEGRKDTRALRSWMARVTAECSQASSS